MKPRHLRPLPDPAELETQSTQEITADVGRLPYHLRPWCVLAPRVPGGWIVTPPFQLTVGGVWVIVARSTAADPDPEWPPYFVESGIDPDHAVLNLAACFED